MLEYVNLIFEQADVFDVIGCVTGCAGLLVSILVFFRDVIKERHNIIIKFHQPECVFFDTPSELSQCLAKYQAILHVQFINKSSCPVTICYLDTFT